MMPHPSLQIAAFAEPAPSMHTTAKQSYLFVATLPSTCVAARRPSTVLIPRGPSVQKRNRPDTAPSKS